MDLKEQSIQRLTQLNSTLAEKKELCSSNGILYDFPSILTQRYEVTGVGVIICKKGAFNFRLNQQELIAKSGETLFIPSGSFLQITNESPDLEVMILIYQIDSIRNSLGNLVLTMFPYSKLAAEPCYVWSTGEECDITQYIALLDSTEEIKKSWFSQQEQKLLLIALTHRLCSIYSRKLLLQQGALSHKHEIFIKLIQEIEHSYMQERRVEFYANRLCLSPKYLSTLSKEICGYTVQELIFKAIIQKSIALLQHTQKTIQEIADEFNFSNASHFGTFFKKQTGISPLHYRKSL